MYRGDNLLQEVRDPFGQIQRGLTYYGANDPGGPAGMLKTETDYNGLTTRYVYDSDHRIHEKWDPHHIPTTFGYDNLARVTGQTRAGLTTTFTYDENDNRESVTDGEVRSSPAPSA